MKTNSIIYNYIYGYYFIAVFKKSKISSKYPNEVYDGTEIQEPF